MRNVKLLYNVNYSFFQTNTDIEIYENNIYFNLNENLYQLNLNNKELKILITAPIKSFTISNKKIFVSTIKKNSNLYEVRELYSTFRLGKKICRELKSVFKLKSLSNKLYMYDKYDEKVYIYDLLNKNLLDISSIDRNPIAIFLQDNNMYYSINTSDETNSYGSIVSIEKKVDIENFANNKVIYGKINSIQTEIVCDDEWIYFLEVENYYESYYLNEDKITKIYRIKKNGEKLQKICEDIACDIVIYGEWIYFINKSYNNNLYRIKKNGYDKECIDVNYNINLIIINNYIYYFSINSSDMFDKAINIVLERRRRSNNTDLTILTNDDIANNTYKLGIHGELQKLLELKKKEVTYTFRRICLINIEKEDLANI